jgi:MFS family permease
MAGAGVVFPLLPFYSEHFGATPEVIGLLLSSYSLCQFVSAPWIGRPSDSFGRKPVLIGSQLGTFLGFILLALSHCLLWVFVARIMDGLTAGNMSVASACAVDGSTPSTRKQAIGVISAAAGIGIIVGPALSGFFSAHSTTAPVWAAAALSAMSILATAFLLPTQPRSAASTRKRPPLTSMVTRQNLPVFGLLLFFYMAFTLSMSQFALVLAARFVFHGRPLGLRDIGLVFTALGSANIFVQFVLMKHLGAVLSNRTLAALSFGMLALGYATIGATTSSLSSEQRFLSSASGRLSHGPL